MYIYLSIHRELPIRPAIIINRASFDQIDIGEYVRAWDAWAPSKQTTQNYQTIEIRDKNLDENYAQFEMILQNTQGSLLKTNKVQTITRELWHIQWANAAPIRDAAEWGIRLAVIGDNFFFLIEWYVWMEWFVIHKINKNLCKIIKFQRFVWGGLRAYG